MPIMAVVDQNDARGSTQFLARTASRCIEGTLDPSKHAVALNNLFRLLSIYRSNKLAGYHYRPGTHRGPEALTLMPSQDRRVDQVAEALEAALVETYGQEERSAVFEALDDVIRKVASSRTADLGEAQKGNALAFMNSFSRRLQPGL